MGLHGWSGTTAVSKEAGDEMSPSMAMGTLAPSPCRHKRRPPDDEQLDGREDLHEEW